MSKKIQVVLGHLFGDEGKGATVQWLCRGAADRNENPLVVCFSGGPQNAHNVQCGTVEHTCASFGSGVLLGVPTYHSDQYYVDPICVTTEYNVLRSKGIADPVSMYSLDCRVITPYDVEAGRADAKVTSDGTCGRGIYATFKRHREIPLTVRDMHETTVADIKRILRKIARYWNVPHDPAVDDAFCKYAGEFAALNTRSHTRCGLTRNTTVEEVTGKFGTVICEGSQGLLLDMDHGYAPHVTPSRVGLNGLPECLRRNAEVFFVTRTYLTRHGNGYVPVHPLDWDWSTEHEANVWNEYQGNFKRGALELNLLEDAFDRHRIPEYLEKYGMPAHLVVTHCDTAAKISGGSRPVLADESGLILDSCDTPEDAAHMVWSWLGTADTFTDVYWSDNWESNFRKLDRTPVIP